MPRNEKTLGNYLRDAGYHTGYFGKLHFDGRDQATKRAIHFGFDESFLFEDWMKSFTTYFATAKSRVEKEFWGPMAGKTWTGRLSDRELHHEEVITHRAVSFMERTCRPFLCVVGFHGPHPPYAAPDEFSRLYTREKMSVPAQRIVNQNGHILTDEEWRELKAQYYGSVSWIDDCVGRLTKSLGPDTIVVYTSDHGDILGDHGLFSKGMFAFDGNVRVPLLMKLPDVAATTYQHLVQSIDIVPTVLAACGVGMPQGIQGRSLLKAVKSDEPVNSAVLSMIGHMPRLRMVRTPELKYWLCGDEEYLFDLVKDPREEMNRCGHPVWLSRMRLLLAQSLIRAEDPLPLPV
jgi:arylsulfatase A-like enzyme